MLLLQIFTMLVATSLSGDPNFIDKIGVGYEDMNPYTGPGALAELGAIAVMLPALALALLIVRDRPFSSLSSSRGGWNWSLFLKCLGIALIVYVISYVIEFALDPVIEYGPNRFTIVGAIMCLIFIPMQSLAEEYIFRGFILQTVGAWTKLPVVAIIVSAIIFAAGHPYNLIGVITIFINGLVWGVIVWKSRGLEATSAIHIVNNMIAFFMSGLGLEASTSEIDVLSMVIVIAIDLVYAVVILLLGTRLNWFAATSDGTAKWNQKWYAKKARKQQRKGGAAPVGYPPQPQGAYPQQAAYPQVAYPQAQQQAAYPQVAYPQAQQQAAYPQQPQAYPQVTQPQERSPYPQPPYPPQQ